MSKRRAIALVAAGLVAGLVIGNMAIATAAGPADAPRAGATVAEACTGAALRMGGMMRDAGGRLLDIVADLTGLSTDEVKEQRAAGESIANIAASAGVDSDEVVDAALETREQLLAEKVADGTITQEQADAMLEQMSERLADRITSTETGRNGGRGLGAGPGGGNGPRGGGKGQQRAGCGMGTGACPGTCAPAQ